MTASEQAARRSMVSIVVPALDEVENATGLIKRYRDFKELHPAYAFELVVVDDGSTDGTADKLCELAMPDDQLTLVQLSRSFGSHYAITAGFSRCNGDCAVVVGADLQEPVELLEQLLSHWQNGSDVVWGVRRSRASSKIRTATSKLFSWMFTRFANLPSYPPEGPSCMLIDRVVVDAVLEMPERNRNLFALVAWLGFNQSRLTFDLVGREHGASRWTTRKMIKLAVDSLLQFSVFPLRFASLCGLILAFIGLLYAVLLVVRGLLGVVTPSGWPTVIVVVLVIGGAQLLIVGIMGEYMWRGLDESRNRPLYVIRDVRVSDPSSTNANSRPRRGIRFTDTKVSSPGAPGQGDQPPTKIT